MKEKKHALREWFAGDEALRENEINANRQMVFTCAVSSLVMLFIYFGYIFKLFYMRDYTMVYIFMPIDIIILLIPLLFLKTKVLQKYWFKYVLMGLFLFVVGVVNVVIPKHGILAWSIAILISNHYYSRRFGAMTFGASLILMLLCIYLGMFFGEYDPTLLTEGLVVDGKIVNPESPLERWQMLHDMIVQKGDNRYIKVFFYYYMPRAAILLILWFASNALNKRTFTLLKREKDINAEKQKLENELTIAAKIQEAALPKGDYSNQEIAIKASLFPAKQIGGDFYDYYFLDRHHLAFVIGDVSGKGAPAALFMMKAVTCFKNAVSLDKTAMEIMNEVNQNLIKGNDGEMFVTAFFGILDTRNGELRYVNAGHCPPLLSRRGRFFYLPCATGFILGAYEMAPFKEETISLEPGGMLVIYTDGITEAKNKQDELFGKKHLLEVVNRFHYKSGKALFREVLDEVGTFINGAEQSDDMTGMIIHYLYEDISWQERSLDSRKDTADEAIDFFERNMENDRISPKLAKSIAICVDEIYSNIAKYAYADQEGGEIFLRYCYYKKQKEMTLTFIDHGSAYDPTKQEKHLVDPNGKEGGLGLLIVSNLMDDVDYDRRNGKNFLVLTKKVNS